MTSGDSVDAAPMAENAGSSVVTRRGESSFPMMAFNPSLIVRGIFVLLGIGVLVPWNAFISAKGYFQTRFCDPTDPAESQNDTMESTFAMVYNFSSVISLGAIIFGQWLLEKVATRRLAPDEVDVQEETGLVIAEQAATAIESDQQEPVLDDHSNQSSLVEDEHQRSEAEKGSNAGFVTIPLTLFLVVFLGQTYLTLTVNGASPTSVKVWTLVSLIVCGVSSALATAGIVATAGSFREADMAMNPFLAGQSVGGVAVSLANFVAACVGGPGDYFHEHCAAGNSSNLSNIMSDSPVFADERYLPELESLVAPVMNLHCVGYQRVDWGVFTYFLLGSLVLIACLVGYSWISRLCEMVEDRTDQQQLSHYGTVPNQENSSSYTLHDSFRRGLELSVPSHDLDTPEAVCVADTCRSETLSRPVTPTSSDNLIDATNRQPLHTEIQENEISEVFLLIRGAIFCIFVTFVVTLSLFPGLTSELRSARQCVTDTRVFNDLYTPFSFLLFNIGDLCGRLFAGEPKVFGIVSNRLVSLAFLRFLFLPLFLLCPSGRNSGHEVQIQSDMYSYCVQFAFAVSNGALLTSAFAHAPTLMPVDKNAERHRQSMSEMLSFSVAFGLLTGSLLSFPVSRLA